MAPPKKQVKIIQNCVVQPAKGTDDNPKVFNIFKDPRIVSYVKEKGFRMSDLLSRGFYVPPDLNPDEKREFIRSRKAELDKVLSYVKKLQEEHAAQYGTQESSRKQENEHEMLALDIYIRYVLKKIVFLSECLYHDCSCVYEIQKLANICRYIFKESNEEMFCTTIQSFSKTDKRDAATTIEPIIEESDHESDEQNVQSPDTTSKNDDNRMDVGCSRIPNLDFQTGNNNNNLNVQRRVSKAKSSDYSFYFHQTYDRPFMKKNELKKLARKPWMTVYLSATEHEDIPDDNRKKRPQPNSKRKKNATNVQANKKIKKNSKITRKNTRIFGKTIENIVTILNGDNDRNENIFKMPKPKPLTPVAKKKKTNNRVIKKTQKKIESDRETISRRLRSTHINLNNPQNRKLLVDIHPLDDEDMFYIKRKSVAPKILLEQKSYVPPKKKSRTKL